MNRMISAIKAYRTTHVAPVDVYGCHLLATSNDPKTKRFEALISLMLSSQTKDEITAEAIKLLQSLPGGLSVENILSLPSEAIHKCIAKVGFHNKKLVYMKQIAQVLKYEYNGDIPNTYEGSFISSQFQQRGMMNLVGIGPKMAILCLNAAWDMDVGISVDTHVHRLSNRLGWITSRTPEETRTKLEAIIPREEWKEINPLLVGFGQTICFAVSPKCSLCPISDLCPKILVKKPKKIKTNPSKLEDDSNIETNRASERKKVLQHVKVEYEDLPMIMDDECTKIKIKNVRNEDKLENTGVLNQDKSETTCILPCSQNLTPLRSSPRIKREAKSFSQNDNFKVRNF